MSEMWWLVQVRQYSSSWRLPKYLDMASVALRSTVACCPLDAASGFVGRQNWARVSKRSSFGTNPSAPMESFAYFVAVCSTSSRSRWGASCTLGRSKHNITPRWTWTSLLGRGSTDYRCRTILYFFKILYRGSSSLHRGR